MRADRGRVFGIRRKLLSGLWPPKEIILMFVFCCLEVYFVKLYKMIKSRQSCLQFCMLQGGSQSKVSRAVLAQMSIFVLQN